MWEAKRCDLIFVVFDFFPRNFCTGIHRFFGSDISFLKSTPDIDFEAEILAKSTVLIILTKLNIFLQMFYSISREY